MFKVHFNFRPLFTLLAIVSFWVVFSLIFTSNSYAANGVPRTMNFQGRVVNNTTGINIANGTVKMIFSLYNGASGGTPLWTETQNSVPVADGIFRAVLGSQTPIPANFNFNWDGLYLGVAVGNDSEMAPRIQLASVPFAFNAQQVAGLTVQDSAGSVASTSATLKIGSSAVNPITVDLGQNGLTFNSGAYNSSTSLTIATTNEVATSITLPTLGTLLSNGLNSNQTVTSTQVSGNVLSIADTSGTGTLAGLSFNLSGSGTTYDLLGTGSSWSMTKTGALTVASCSGCGTGGGGGPSFWQELIGALSPVNLGDDLLIGGSTTTSAKFAFTGLMGNQTQASFSGNLIVMPNNGYGGRVGIGTTTPVAPLQVASSWSNFTADLVQTVTNSSNTSSGAGDVYGQSFTPTVSGKGLQVDFCTDTGANGKTSRLYSGDGNGGALLTTGAWVDLGIFCSSSYPTFTWHRTVFYNVAISSGSQYTAYVSNTGTVSFTIANTSSNPYAGGQMWFGGSSMPSSDATFRTYSLTTTAGGLGLAAAFTGNVGIGTTSPTEALSILGQNNVGLLGVYDGTTSNQNLLVDVGGATTLKPTGFDAVLNCTGSANCTASGADGGSFADNTAEANISRGTAFNMWATSTAANTSMYFGLDHPFGVISFDISAADVATTVLNAQYWNGSAWTSLSNVADSTVILTKDGTVTFTIPSDWTAKSVNSSVSLYYVRLYGTTNATTAPTVFSVSPTSGTRLSVLAGIGDANPALLVTDQGNVGIGTSLSTLNGTGTSTNKLYITGGVTDTAIYINAGSAATGTGISMSPQTGTGISLGNGISSGVGISASGLGETSGNVISISNNGPGTYAAFTGAFININPRKTQTAAVSVNNTGNYLYIARNDTVNNIGATWTVTGDLVALSSNCTVTAGVCADTSHILSLTQSLASASGSVFFIINNGLGIGAQIISNSGGQAAFMVQDTGNGDLFTASNSAGTVFTVGNNGSTGTQTYASASGNLILMPNNGYGGQLGIGTTNPGANLDINNNTKGIGINLSTDITTGGTGIKIGNVYSTGGTGININNVNGTNATGLKITIVQGASSGISINPQGLTSGKAIDISGGTTGGLANFSGKLLNISSADTLTSTNVTYSGNSANISRSLSVNNVGSTFTISGDLMTLSSNCTVTSGVCADTSHLLSLTQSLASASGSVLFINNGGSGIAFNAISTSSLTSVASISGSTTFAALVSNNNGSGDLFTASASGWTRFTINNNGNIAATGTLTGLTGLTLASGPITLGGATGTGLCLTGGATAGWGSCGTGGTGTNWWNLTNGNSGSGLGYITPVNSTADLLIGGQSTASAKFAILNLNSGTPTATVAGNLIVMPWTNGSNELGGKLGIGTNAPGGNLDVRGQGIVSATAGTLDPNYDTLLVGQRPAADSYGSVRISPQNSQFRGYKLEVFDNNTTANYFDIYDVANSVDRLHINSSGYVGIGTTAPAAMLDLRGAFGTGTTPIASISGQTSFATLVANNNGVGDLFTASASGWTRFVIQNNGNVGIGTNLPTAMLDVVGNASLSGTLAFRAGAGNIQTTAFNTLNLGGSSTGQVVLSGFNGTVNSITFAGYTTAGCTLKTTATGVVICGTDLTGGAGASPFTENSTLGYIFQNNTTEDLLLGGTSTASADFHVYVNTSGTITAGTASTSGDLVFAGTGGRNMDILNGQSFSLRTSPGGAGSIQSRLSLPSTGDIIFYSQGGTELLRLKSDVSDFVGIGQSSPRAKLDVNGNASASGSLSLDSVSAALQSTKNQLLTIGGNTTGYISLMPNNGIGSVGINTATPLAALDVRGNFGTGPVASFSANTSFATLVVNNNGVGDLFTASASGWTRFTITNTGGIGLGMANGLVNIGTSSNCLIGGATASWGSCGGAPLGGYPFYNSGGYITQSITTEDLLIGGMSTTSADFAFTGLNSLTGQTQASFSGNLILMPNNGYGGNVGIGYTNLGTAALAVNGNVGIGTTNPGATLEISNPSTVTSGTMLMLTSKASSGSTIGINFSASSGPWQDGTLINMPAGLRTGTGISMSASGLTSGYGINITGALGQPVTNFTGSIIGINAGRSQGLAFNVTDSGNFINAVRNNVVANAGSTITNTGDLVSLSSNCTVTSGQCVDTSHLLSLTQSYASASGSVLFINNGGSGIALNAVSNGNTTSVASMSGTTSFAALVTNNDGVGDLFTASASGWTRFVIQNNGNVGIGTNTPDTKLQILGGTDASLSNGSGYLVLGPTSGVNLVIDENEIQARNNGVGSIFKLNAQGGAVMIGGGSGNNTPLANIDLRQAYSGTIAIASVSGKTSFAGLVVDQSGAGDIFTASAAGATRFSIRQNGSILMQGQMVTSVGIGGTNTTSGSVINAIGDQGSMVPNAGFESAVSGIGLADGWVTSATNGAIQVISRVATTSAKGIASIQVKLNASQMTAFYSTCMPIAFQTGLGSYNISMYAKSTVANKVVVRGYIDSYPSQANCMSDNSTGRVVVPGTLTAGGSNLSTTNWTTLSQTAIQAPATTTNTWGRVHIFVGNPASGTTATVINIDAVRLIENALTGGVDYAENYPADPNNIPQAGDVVSIDSLGGSAQVALSNKPMDNSVIGVVSTNPGEVLGQDVPDPKVPVALSGRVPVKVSSENGVIHIGDYLASSDIPGVAVKAVAAGQVIGIAMEDYTNSDPAGVGSITAFIKNTYYNGGSLASNTGLTSDNNKDVILPLTANGSFIIKNANGASLATFDTNGNATFSGTLTVDKINANQIAGLDVITSRIAALEAKTAVLSDATGSAELATGAASLPPALTLDSLNVAGLATVSADLNVGGNSFIRGALNVLDSITTPNLLVSQFAYFIQDVVFKGNVLFNSTPTFNSDTAGFAVVNKGYQSVDVAFSTEYATTPVVTASIALDKMTDATAAAKLDNAILGGNISYIITNRSSKGFTIKLNQPAGNDISFSWVALSVQNAQTQSSISNQNSLSNNPSSTQSAAFQSILNQLNVQTPTPNQ